MPFASKARLFANRYLQGDNFEAKLIAQGFEGIIKGGVFTIEFVDYYHAWQVALISILPGKFCAHLYAFFSRYHDECSIGDP